MWDVWGTLYGPAPLYWSKMFISSFWISIFAHKPRYMREPKQSVNKMTQGVRTAAKVLRYVNTTLHGDVSKWEHFPRYWPFVRGIHRSPVNSPHKGQWRGALMFSLICAWINGWVNNREASDLGLHRAHYDDIVMSFNQLKSHNAWFF